MLLLLILLAAWLQSTPMLACRTAAQACDLFAPPLVIVVATGRSGSTSLLSLLRDVPGAEFFGENAGISHALWDLWERLRMAREFTEQEACLPSRPLERNDTSGCLLFRPTWLHGGRPESERLLSLFREMVYALLSWPCGQDVSLIGWKEIRWAPRYGDVKFLVRLFPCIKVVINYRHDVTGQLRSGFWALDTTNQTIARGRLEASNKLMDELHAYLGPERSRLLTMGQLNDITALQQLVDWLGLRRKCTVLRPPHVNHRGSAADGVSVWSGHDSTSSAICVKNATAHGCSRNPAYTPQLLDCQ